MELRVQQPLPEPATQPNCHQQAGNQHLPSSPVASNGKPAFFHKEGTYLSLLALLLIFFAAGCKRSDSDPATTPGDQQLNKAIELLGGKEAITGVQRISYEAVSTAYEWEQTTPVEPDPVFSNETHYKWTSELNKRKGRIDYTYINHDKPFAYPTYGGNIIINDKRAVVTGEYNWLSYYFNHTYSQSIWPSRLEAILKTQRMSNPLELIKEILANKESGEADNDNNPLTLPTMIKGLDIEFILDPATSLPAGAKIMEEDYLNGDVYFEVKYKDWITVGKTKYPSKVEHFVRNKIIKKEAYTNIQLNPQLPSENFFTPPDPVTPVNYDKKNAEHGFLYSQWHNRWIAWGILIDQPLDNGALVLERYDLTGVAIPSQIIGPNLKVIGRPDLRTWTMAINTPEGIYTVESPLNTNWCKSIIKTIKEEWPGKPILANIVTHTHHVSFAGVREFAAETGKIYVGKAGEEVAKTAVNAKHTLAPDELSNHPRKVDIIPVSGRVDLAGGAIQIYPLKTKAAPTPLSGPHSDDMVVVYVPEYKAIIQCDMLWTGEYMEIWYKRSSRGFTPKANAELVRRARYLLDWIQESGLEVDKIVSVHGGLAPMQELIDVAEH